ncbi:MAG TPA: hypothetical protein VMN37_00545 [Gemmatimonadales bacterium]|nr:hypothetical protein [Gemmatimonadales bacterium]
MIRPVSCLAFAAALAVAGCGGGDRPSGAVEDAALPPDQRDAEALGREIFDLVDRAVDYRGSHRGRPARSLRQMGVDSLTPATARLLITVEREPVVTVRYRTAEGREITSCRGDSQILEEATISGGRFTLMCTTRSGAQRPIRVGGPR